MTSRDNEYQDSGATGSLVGALALWRALVAAKAHTRPRQLVFGIACSSESRARRVAAHLRRNSACARTQVNSVAADARKNWRIDGSTRAEIQTLANLEHLFTWLRRASRSHQVHLLELRLA
jgi:hypothetical protein